MFKVFGKRGKLGLDGQPALLRLKAREEMDALFDVGQTDFHYAVELW